MQLHAIAFDNLNLRNAKLNFIKNKSSNGNQIRKDELKIVARCKLLEQSRSKMGGELNYY